MVTLYLEPLSLCDVTALCHYTYILGLVFSFACVLCIALNGHRPKTYNFHFIVIRGYT